MELSGIKDVSTYYPLYYYNTQMRKLLFHIITLLGLLTASLLAAHSSAAPGDCIYISGGAAVIQIENVVSEEVIYIHGGARVFGPELQKSNLTSFNTDNGKPKPKTVKIYAVTSKPVVAKPKPDTRIKVPAPTQLIRLPPFSDAASLFYAVHAILVAACVPVGSAGKISALLSFYSQNLQGVFASVYQKSNYPYCYSTILHISSPILYSRPPTA